ncbi:MAG: hypothetical protein JNM94_07000 [Phycisphaerae bacterium]|nr:hypothetical protein [Phycisphaerae bacterium]
MSGAFGDSVTYEVGPTSAFLKGCFPPCMCPLAAFGLTGSFELSPTLEPSRVTTYDVSNLVLVATTAETFVTLVGGGTYSIAGAKGDLQRLELELIVGVDEPVHFDSGWVPVEVEWPAISIVVPMNDMTCFDQVVDLVAAPSQAISADLDGDGSVNGLDLGSLLSAWGSCAFPAPCFGDLDGDGQIGASDLSILLGAWTG